MRKTTLCSGRRASSQHARATMGTPIVTLKPNAFELAAFGIVGNLFQVLPQAAAEIRKWKG